MIVVNKDAVRDGGLCPRLSYVFDSAYSLHYTQHHPQNQKYITYCIIAREGPRHGHW